MRDDYPSGETPDDEVPAKAKTRKTREFSATTRKDLERAAGGRCSVRSCLDLTSCRKEKRSGEYGSASQGRAAHIYAAAPNGPRPAPPGMTDEQIADFANGIWACADHADTIDSHEYAYTVSMLQEMKAVREFTQHLIINAPILQFLEKFMGAYIIDEIVWAHLPELDRDKVLAALLTEGQKRFADVPLARTMPTPPPAFALTPVATATRATVSEASQATQQSVAGTFEPYLDDVLRERATVILAGWSESMRSKYWTQGGGIIHHCLVKLAARDPRTGDLSKAAVLVQADALGLCKHSILDGEEFRLNILHSTSPVNDLDWRLSIRVVKGKSTISSTLRRSGPIRPRDLGNPYEWADFENYCQVLECLARGWEPLGFVSRIAGGSDETNGLDPEPFGIALGITADELTDALARCDKVRLARELQAQWRKLFVWTEDFFDPALDVVIIKNAADELFNRMAGPYWTRGCSDVLFANGAREVRLEVSDWKVQVRSFRQIDDRPGAGHVRVRE